MAHKPLAIIPARGGSKRFPRKNVALLHGKPLLAYAVEAAKESGVFDAVCVSSDDDEILSIAKEYGADLALKRPAKFATDTARLIHVCKYLLESLTHEKRDYPVFGLILPTNPMRTAEDVRGAWKLFCEEDCSGVISVVPFIHPPQQALRIKNRFIEPAFGMEYMVPAQQLEKLYIEDGSITFIKTGVFLERGELYGPGMVPYILPPDRSVDIDIPFDLEWAEFLMGRDKR